MALIHDMGEALIGDITPSDGISSSSVNHSFCLASPKIEPEQKFDQEEMALKFLACTIRSSNSDFADSILDLWREYEEGKSEAAILVREIDKLECIHQADVYEQRSGADLSEFMELKEKVTLPGWQPLLNDCLYKHEETRMRKANNPIVIFVSGKLCCFILYGFANCLRGSWCWERNAEHTSRKRIRLPPHFCWRLVAGGGSTSSISISRFHT